MVGSSMSTEIEKKYTDEEFCKMYGIDRRTAKRWRDRRYVNFIKTPSGKIRYLQRHIDEFDRRGEKNAKKRAA
jgi:predicted site-specific integrase-resolvase